MTKSGLRNSTTKDFENGRLGDKRLTKRLLHIATTMAANPSASLPQIFIEKQDLDNTYSFLSNDGVEESALWDAHREGTVKRCKDYKEILVIHDTTEFAFDDFGFERQYLSQISTNRQGFYGHFSIAVSNEINPMPLGTLNAIHFVHKEQVGEETAEWWNERGGLLENEHDRWLQGCRSADRALQGVECQIIHLCDREGDSYELMGSLIEDRQQFVIRCSSRDRRCRDQKRKIVSLESLLLEAQHGVETREILVPSTKTKAGIKKAKNTPLIEVRKESLHRRLTNVQIRWRSVTMDRQRLKNVPRDLTVNVVEVFEHVVPEGFEAVSWILLTTLPINTEEDAWKIVDIYRHRWMIEEFFKATKTGASYEKRQITTAHGLLNILAISAAIAADLLLMRACDRNHPHREATWIADADFVTMVKILTPQKQFSKIPTVHEVLDAVARYGGHRKSNGPPGWQILYRGFVKILHALQVARLFGHFPSTA